MKCAYHNNEEAVATCNICGKALCPACASVVNPPQCIGCYKDSLVNRKSAVRHSLITDVLSGLAVAIFLPIFYKYWGVSSGSFVGEFLLLAGIPFGWRFLNKITPQIFLFLPLIGWIIYVGVKLMLSLLIGIFVAPYTIWKKIKEMKQLQHLIDSVENKDNKNLAIGMP